MTTQLNKAEAVWTALGSHVVQMSPQMHDATYAAVSHLPHLLAFAFMNSISGQENGQKYMSLAGPGFRDFTRIAASDPQMWRDILIANREELLLQSKKFQEALQSFDELIDSGSTDALEFQIKQASETRANWRISSHKTLK